MDIWFGLPETLTVAFKTKHPSSITEADESTSLADFVGTVCDPISRIKQQTTPYEGQ